MPRGSCSSHAIGGRCARPSSSATSSAIGDADGSLRELQAAARRHQVARRLAADDAGVHRAAGRAHPASSSSGIAPPEELAASHALLVSAVQLAGQSPRQIRREAALASDMTRAWDASSAAAGALMLGGKGARATFNQRCGCHNSGDHPSPDAAGPRPGSAGVPARAHRPVSCRPRIQYRTRRRSDAARRGSCSGRVALRSRDARHARRALRRLHARLADPPRRLTALERDVIAQAAARAAAAAARGAVVPAPARPGRRDAALLRSAAPPVAAGGALRRAHRRGARLGRRRSRDARGCARRRDFWRETFREYERRVRDSGGVRRAHAARTADRRAGARSGPPRRSSRLPTGSPMPTGSIPPTSIC